MLTFDAVALQYSWSAENLPEVTALELTRLTAIDQVTGVLAAGSADVRVQMVPAHRD